MSSQQQAAPPKPQKSRQAHPTTTSSIPPAPTQTQRTAQTRQQQGVSEGQPPYGLKPGDFARLIGNRNAGPDEITRLIEQADKILGKKKDPEPDAGIPPPLPPKDEGKRVLKR